MASHRMSWSPEQLVSENGGVLQVINPGPLHALKEKRRQETERRLGTTKCVLATKRFRNCVFASQLLRVAFGESMQGASRTLNIWRETAAFGAEEYLLLLIGSESHDAPFHQLWTHLVQLEKNNHKEFWTSSKNCTILKFLSPIAIELNKICKKLEKVGNNHVADHALMLAAVNHLKASWLEEINPVVLAATATPTLRISVLPEALALQTQPSPGTTEESREESTQEQPVKKTSKGFVRGACGKFVKLFKKGKKDEPKKELALFAFGENVSERRASQQNISSPSLCAEAEFLSDEPQPHCSYSTSSNNNNNTSEMNNGTDNSTPRESRNMPETDPPETPSYTPPTSEQLKNCSYTYSETHDIWSTRNLTISRAENEEPKPCCSFVDFTQQRITNVERGEIDGATVPDYGNFQNMAIPDSSEAKDTGRTESPPTPHCSYVTTTSSNPESNMDYPIYEPNYPNEHYGSNYSNMTEDNVFPNCAYDNYTYGNLDDFNNVETPEHHYSMVRNSSYDNGFGFAIQNPIYYEYSPTSEFLDNAIFEERQEQVYENVSANMPNQHHSQYSLSDVTLDELFDLREYETSEVDEEDTRDVDCTKEEMSNSECELTKEYSHSLNSPTNSENNNISIDEFVEDETPCASFGNARSSTLQNETEDWKSECEHTSSRNTTEAETQNDAELHHSENNTESIAEEVIEATLSQTDNYTSLELSTYEITEPQITNADNNNTNAESTKKEETVETHRKYVKYNRRNRRKTIVPMAKNESIKPNCSADIAIHNPLYYENALTPEFLDNPNFEERQEQVYENVSANMPNQHHSQYSLSDVNLDELFDLREYETSEVDKEDTRDVDCTKEDMSNSDCELTKEYNDSLNSLTNNDHNNISNDDFVEDETTGPSFGSTAQTETEDYKSDSEDPSSRNTTEAETQNDAELYHSENNTESITQEVIEAPLSQPDKTSSLELSTDEITGSQITNADNDNTIAESTKKEETVEVHRKYVKFNRRNRRKTIVPMAKDESIKPNSLCLNKEKKNDKTIEMHYSYVKYNPTHSNTTVDESNESDVEDNPDLQSISPNSTSICADTSDKTGETGNDAEHEEMLISYPDNANNSSNSNQNGMVDTNENETTAIGSEKNQCSDINEISDMSPDNNQTCRDSASCDVESEHRTDICVSGVEIEDPNFESMTVTADFGPEDDDEGLEAHLIAGENDNPNVCEDSHTYENISTRNDHICDDSIVNGGECPAVEGSSENGHTNDPVGQNSEGTGLTIPPTITPPVVLQSQKDETGRILPQGIPDDLRPFQRYVEIIQAKLSEISSEASRLSLPLVPLHEDIIRVISVDPAKSKNAEEAMAYVLESCDKFLDPGLAGGLTIHQKISLATYLCKMLRNARACAQKVNVLTRIMKSEKKNLRRILKYFSDISNATPPPKPPRSPQIAKNQALPGSSGQAGLEVQDQPRASSSLPARTLELEAKF